MAGRQAGVRQAGWAGKRLAHLLGTGGGGGLTRLGRAGLGKGQQPTQWYLMKLQ